MVASPEREADAEPVLSARRLSHSLGAHAARTTVLKSVDLDLYAGQICSVVGPSGCGKTTLLYLLGLLDRPDSGEIYLKGREVSGLKDPERDRLRGREIGFIFQFHHLLAEFSALDNLCLPMLKQGWQPKAARQRAEEVLAAVGLAQKAQRPADQLSGGEQQRVAVARALAGRPSVILADEPTGNLDEANAAAVFDLFRRLAQEDGVAVLMVTHNARLAEGTDRRLHMRSGQFTPAT